MTRCYYLGVIRSAIICTFHPATGLSEGSSLVYINSPYRVISRPDVRLIVRAAGRAREKCNSGKENLRTRASISLHDKLHFRAIIERDIKHEFR